MELRHSKTLSTQCAHSPELDKILNEGKVKTDALCQLVASINIHSGVAVIMHADESHHHLNTQSITIPEDVLQMLSMTPLSAPIAAEHFTLPHSLLGYKNSYLVVATICSIQGAIEAIAITFVKTRSLNAAQHSYLDITRQRVELAFHYQLLKHPYTEKLTQQLALLEEVSKVSRVGAWELDRESGNLQCTSIVREILGLGHLKFISYHHIIALLPPDKQRALLTSLLRAVRGKSRFETHFSIKDKERRERSIKLTAYAELDRSKGVKLKRLYGALQDETQAQLLSDAQSDFADYMSQILNHVDGVVFSVNQEGIVLAANEQISVILGYSPDELIGQDLNVIFATDRANKLCFESVTEGEFGHDIRHKNGRRIRCQVVFKQCQIHQQSLTVVTIKDYTSRQQELDHFKKLAFSDAVTELPNLNNLERYVHEIGAKANTLPSTRVFIRIAIQHISEYEEVFGPATIDYIMRIISNRLKRTFEESTYMLISGELGAFYIVLTQPFVDSTSSCEAISKVCNLLEAHVLTPFALHNNTLQISANTVSCTIASQHISYKKLIECMTVKAIHKGTSLSTGSLVNHVTHISTQDIERHNYIKRSLPRAMSGDELFIELQPQYDANKNIVSSEVLLRWLHPQLDVIAPSEFIPIAEEDDIIAELGLWVCERACRLLSDCLAQNRSTQLALNISTKHLARADFVAKFVAIVERWKVPTQLLTLEIAEEALNRGICIIKQRIQVLAEFGFNISIGHFGASDSNLSYLESLPIKEVKVDRFFIEDVEDASQKRLLVRSICSFARAMKINTVAEGIESDFQLSQAESCGCSSFQGFWLDKPMSVEQWREKLISN